MIALDSGGYSVESGNELFIASTKGSIDDSSAEDDMWDSSNLDFREVVTHLASSIKCYTDPDATIVARYEKRARFFTNTFRAACDRDPNDIEIRDHLIIRSSSAVSDLHYLFHDIREEMVKRGRACLVELADAHMYR